MYLAKKNLLTYQQIELRTHNGSTAESTHVDDNVRSNICVCASSNQTTYQTAYYIFHTQSLDRFLLYLSSINLLTISSIVFLFLRELFTYMDIKAQ